MPRWDDKRCRYVEEEQTYTDCYGVEKPSLTLKEQREERFRTALLNELDTIGRALRSIDRSLPDRSET